jgi:hypothetical protein
MVHPPAAINWENDELHNDGDTPDMSDEQRVFTSTNSLLRDGPSRRFGSFLKYTASALNPSPKI